MDTLWRRYPPTHLSRAKMLYAKYFLLSILSGDENCLESLKVCFGRRAESSFGLDLLVMRDLIEKMEVEDEESSARGDLYVNDVPVFSARSSQRTVCTIGGLCLMM